MKEAIQWIAAVSVIFVFTGCSNESLRPAEFVKWVDNQENGLTEQKEVGDFVFQIQYRPKEYMAIIESSKVEVSPEELVLKAEKYADLSYFVLKMKGRKSSEFLYTNISTDEEYELRNLYFSEEMASDLYFISGKDTLHPALYHFEHNYGTAPYNTAIFAFDVQNISTDFQIVYDDYMLGIGQVEFPFKKETLSNLPIVKTSSL